MIDSSEPGIHNAITATGLVKILMAVKYKDGMIYVRQVGESIFIWDALYKGQLYSSFLVVPPEENTADPEVVEELKNMCYAGAGSTIDILRGDQLSDEDKRNVALFESAREKVEKESN